MNVLDTRDLYQEMQELNDRQQQAEDDPYSGVEPLDEEDESRLAALVELFEQIPFANPVTNTAGGDTSVTLIEDSDFPEFARDYAEELAGAAAEFLFSLVDWPRFAAELAINYQWVQFDGTTYTYRY